MITQERKKELFTKAFDLVKNPNTWCIKHLALNRSGVRVTPTHPTATKWCSKGALLKEVFEEDTDFFDEIYLAFYCEKVSIPNDPEIDYANIVVLNDRLPHPQLIRLWGKIGTEKGWL